MTPTTALRWFWGIPRRWRWLCLAICLLGLFAASQLQASRPDPAFKQSFVSRSDARVRGAVIVRAAVLTDDESELYFGASLADHGIQAIWLSVENGGEFGSAVSADRHRSELFLGSRGRPAAASVVEAKRDSSISDAIAHATMPAIVQAKETADGFVFTHREGGLKLFTVGFETGAEELLFQFALPIPGARGASYAIQKVDFSGIYPPSTIEEVDLPTLREKLARMPCCAANKRGEPAGDPLNIVIVGRGLDALFSFTGRGWRLDEPFDLHSAFRTVQAFLFRNEYLNAPISPLHVFGREQEVALQKARNNISLRNHLRLWLAPFTIDGMQVWIGQISRDIGTKLTTQVWYLTTHRISPDVDQDRFYLLQDLIMSGAVSRFGYVQGVGGSTMPNARTNLGGDPYVTDGLRLVVFLGAPPRALDKIEILDWEHPPR